MSWLNKNLEKSPTESLEPTAGSMTQPEEIGKTFSETFSQ
jgi:hypothetical protein